MHHSPVPNDTTIEQLSQLGRRLSVREESGSLSRDLGLLPTRTHQVGASVIAARDQRHVAFIHPPIRSAAQRPSERRAAPRRPDACA